jgi:hypothetical protein
MPQRDDHKADLHALDPLTVQALNAEASRLMKEGIRLMATTGPSVATAALDYFDRALDIRRRLPLDTDPLLRYGLAACWLNRAEALVRLGGDARLAAALVANDAGIVLLRTLPMQDDPRFRRRLAIAQQNRGLALQARSGESPSDDACAAFAEAIATLEHDDAAGVPDRHYLLAATLVNLANALVIQPGADAAASAHDAALRATALVGDSEEQDEDAADVGLRARHVLCRSLAARLSTASTAASGIPDDMHEASDLVDDGLALTRAWERQGVDRFRSLAHDLFRFGARLYASYQPQFLDEFIRENTDPAQSSAGYVDSDAMRSAEQEARELLRPPDPSLRS